MIDKFPRRLSTIILDLPWLLMGIILSNADRGNNIRELCAPIKLEMIDTLEQLVAKNFTLNSYPMSSVVALYVVPKFYFHRYPVTSRPESVL